jgi:OmpA-OmpF porin, OOP family
MRSSFRLVILAAALAPAKASAQTPAGFALDRFEPAPAGDVFFAVPGATVPADGRLRAVAVVDYAHAPLVLRGRADGADLGDIVSRQLVLRVEAALPVAHRVLLSLGMPLVLMNAGDSPAPSGGPGFISPSGAALGDLRAGARLRLVGEARAPFQLAAAGWLWVPTGDRDQFTSDGKVRGAGQLVAGGAVAAASRWSAAVGVVGRPSSPIAGNVAATELTFAAAWGTEVVPRTVVVGPELFGATTVAGGATAFTGRTTNLEALLGAHFWTGPLAVGLGAGPGLTVGMGTPSVRVVASIGYAPFPDPPPPAPEAPPPPPVVAAPAPPPPEPPPPRDQDGDGVPDGEDACLLIPGVRDSDPRKNGCPPDRDGDGIPDGEDACPRESGPRDPDPTKNGCPTLVRVTEKEIVILRKIHFEFNKARIMPDSSELLGQVAQVLKEHPEILEVSIEGHTDDKGSVAFNMSLSQRRADAVKAWLAERGVAGGRLVAKGFGKSKPVDNNRTEEGREMNRRVEFRITRSSATGGAPP